MSEALMGRFFTSRRSSWREVAASSRRVREVTARSIFGTSGSYPSRRVVAHSQHVCGRDDNLRLYLTFVEQRPFFMVDNYVTAVAAVVQAALSLVLIFQLFFLRRTVQGTTQDNLYAHYTHVCELFLDKPYLRPYFYSNEPKPISCPADRPSLNDEIDGASEMILGLIEHAIVQRRNLPRASWSACWEPYAIERVGKSRTIQKFYEDNKGWYANELRSQITKILADAGQKKQEGRV
jgi:hypothetical protein